MRIHTVEFELIDYPNAWQTEAGTWEKGNERLLGAIELPAHFDMVYLFNELAAIEFLNDIEFDKVEFNDQGAYIELFTVSNGYPICKVEVLNYD